ncbi:MAG: radical SAM protein [Bacteroides sp.]|nr:radical SAM protein [Bacteroides sp.]MBD5309972.1 radical SAM protein [Bacteroides sp.]
MKLSRYNIILPFEKYKIYYNSFTDQYIGLPEKIHSILNSVSGIEILKEQFPYQFQHLVELGFIIDKNRDELDEIRFQNKVEAFAPNQLTLMVYPTQDCNLKCWYCYESHIPNTRMSADIQERVVKYVAKNIKNYEKIILSFFGGEPLTDFASIAYPLSLKIKEIAQSHNKKFNTFFITNATLIDDDTVRFLKEINPYFQITLDGDRTKHNTVRIRKEGAKETYDDIICAIKKITRDIYNPETYTNPIITIRINYDNTTLKNISSLLTDLNDIDRKAIHFHLERVWQTRHLINSEQRILLNQTIRNLINLGFSVGHGSFSRKRVSCPAEVKSHMIVNYDGDLFRCNGRTLSKSTREGYLSQEGDPVWDPIIQAKRQGKATFENSECLDCVMLPQCMGPCSQKIIEQNGFNKKICNLNSIDVSLKDYLKGELELRLLVRGGKKIKS